MKSNKKQLSDSHPADQYDKQELSDAFVLDISDRELSDFSDFIDGLEDYLDEVESRELSVSDNQDYMDRLSEQEDD